MFILDSGCPHPIAELFAYSICLTPALFDLQLVPFGSIVFNVLIILTTLMSAEFLNNKFRKFPLYTSPGKDLGTNFVSTPFIVQLLTITPCVVMVRDQSVI